MTTALWQRTLLLFEENQETILGMEPVAPTPVTKWWRESAHRTLGHLTACQAAWLPLMRQLRARESTGSVPIRPDPLYTNLGFATLAWETLVERFVAERTEWRQALEQADLSHIIQTPYRVHTAQTLTRRMVEHEKRHLDELAKG